MIVTKENVAAHAFVKHFLRLGLPESINCLVGRLVGYVEMKKGPANQTALDIPPAFRNDVLRSKRVIVGCGGGFHQECQQPYSPVASWMEEADVALNDEGQQYGNLDEASAIARVPRKCLVVWCGDHKQTPGGLRKTDFFFFLVSRTRHHSCAGHCFTIRSHCNFFRNATIPPGRIKQQKKTKQTATKQNQQRNTNQTQTENQPPEWELSSLFLYNVQLK